MARARKVHCVCGTPVMSATDHGLEFRCDCGATMFIPYVAALRRRAPGSLSSKGEPPRRRVPDPPAGICRSD